MTRMTRPGFNAVLKDVTKVQNSAECRSNSQSASTSYSQPSSTSYSSDKEARFLRAMCPFLSSARGGVKPGWGQGQENWE